jgi:hypothetical protein
VPGTGIPLLSTLSGADVAGATVGSGAEQLASHKTNTNTAKVTLFIRTSISFYMKYGR